MTHTESAPSTNDHAGSTLARVRRAAVTLFAVRGYGATGIRDIAREAGMALATLYHYTSSKEELLVDIMVAGQDALTTAAVRELASRTRPEQRLGALVGTLVSAHATNPLTTRVVDTEIRSLGPGSEGRARVIRLRDDYEQLWTDVLAAGVESKTFDVSDQHITRLALLTMCTGMSNWYRRDAGVDVDELARDFVDLALGTVRAQRGRQRLRVADLPDLMPSNIPVLASEPLP